MTISRFCFNWFLTKFNALNLVDLLFMLERERERERESLARNLQINFLIYNNIARLNSSDLVRVFCILYALPRIFPKEPYLNCFSPLVKVGQDAHVQIGDCMYVFMSILGEGCRDG
jgi:hypothetical protein